MAKRNKNTKVILDVVYGKHKNSAIFYVQNHVKPDPFNVKYTKMLSSLW